MTDRERKIAALLAKAEATDNPHEAEAFSRKAEELMVRWGVDEAVLAAARPNGGGAVPAERIVRERLLFGGWYAPSALRAAWSVLEGFGVLRGYKSETWIASDRGRHGVAARQVLYVVGYEGDVRRFLTLRASLVLQCESARRAWWKTVDGRSLTRMQGVRARRQFEMSFGHAVGIRLAAARRRAAGDAGAGTDLVLRDRGARVQDWLDENVELRTVADWLHGSWLGAAEGRAAGESASIGDGQVRGAGRAVTG